MISDSVQIIGYTSDPFLENESGRRGVTNKGSPNYTVHMVQETRNTCMLITLVKRRTLREHIIKGWFIKKKVCVSWCST